MSPKPIVFRTTHRIRFSDIDSYNHVSTANYATYFIDHRMIGLKDNLGWGGEELERAPFMVWVRRMEIDYIRPVQPDQEIVITSFVREFSGSDAIIECTMEAAGRTMSKCLMIVAHVDRATSRASDWPVERMAMFYEKDA